ncbi:uncharacterized protein PV07_12351 [Cladophialophora immunda]|uniref:Clr5 domain-containing protein n=1 Tax=Cladophialophora immunda TaxID=569365 RepID=A0A0D2ACD7_9EURO|nr:uncharacterized protein PV07_12351 [Cladophialophora immunda]KIW22467.1 hypothetical protein PV07_12351 [Cladophialophora immunda]
MAVVAQSRRSEKLSRSRSSSSDVTQGGRQARAHQKSKLPAKQYNSTEWRRMKEIITQLYCEERVTVAELIRRLHGMGFEVNERMLHTRIRKWKIGRNHKFSEMRMAAHLLAEYIDRQQQQSNASGSGHSITTGNRTSMPNFHIRGERVDHTELMRYFRRKKISDPVSWIKEQKDRFDLSEDVVIVVNADAVPVGEARSSEEDEDTSEHDQEYPRLAIEQVEQTALGNVPRILDATGHTPSARYLDDESLPPTNVNRSSFSVPTLLRPQAYYASEQLNQSMMMYMMSYLSSPTSKADLEPAVHAHTVHAIFASKMQDGISLLANISPQDAKRSLRKPEPNAAKAFASFENGFGLIHRILKNHSPMSLALMLSVVCELADRTVKTGMKNSAIGVLLTKFLTYTHDMAAAVWGTEHPLTIFFDILAREYFCPTVLSSSGSVPLMELILTSLNLSLAQFRLASTATHTTALGSAQDWKQLYVRERLCDALYYCGPTYQATRSSMRRQLFYDQESRYGPTARNVLWTLTNVADDSLSDGDVDQAIRYFQDALDRAERLVDGYGRAKTSFAAREGLGRCWMRKAEEAEAEALWQEEQNRGRVRRENFFDPGHTSQDNNSQPSLNSACCSCRCHCATESNRASSGSSTDNTGTSTPSSSGHSTLSSSRKSCPSTKSQGPYRNHHHQHHQQHRSHGNGHPESPTHKRRQYLIRAHGYFVEAENEARAYFEASSRRIARVSLRRQQAAELLGIVATPESSSCSASSESEDEPAREMSAETDTARLQHPSTVAAAATTTNINLVLGSSSGFGFGG